MRLKLRELDSLFVLGDEWVTPTDICTELGLDHGREWLMVALVLERMVVAGEAEIRNPSSRGARYFRKKAAF